VSFEACLDAVVVRRGPVVHLLLSGELDYGGACILRDAVNDALADPHIRRLDIDAALVSFCDANGAGSLLQAWAHSTRNGVTLRVVRESPQVRRLLEITRRRHLLVPPAGEPCL
jgi:anti-anti-sigma factor